MTRRHQRSPLLRASDFCRPWSLLKYYLSPRYRSRWNRNVVSHVPCGCIRRQARTQTNPRHWRHWHGHLPHDYRHHHRQKPTPMGNSRRGRLGRRLDGLAIRCVLWLQLGSLCLDCHRRNLANFSAAIWDCPWRIFELDGRSEDDSRDAAVQSANR